MKFRYARYSETVLRPVIPVLIRHGEQASAYELLVDSGADINVLPVEVAEDLGIELETGVPAEVVGATDEPQTVYIHEIQVTVGEHTFATRAAFKTVDGDDLYGLAGQRGFFDQFTITFNRHDEVVELHTLEG